MVSPVRVQAHSSQLVLSKTATQSLVYPLYRRNIQATMVIKNSLKRMQLPQALESLKNGTGASTTLPSSVRAVTVNYVYRRAGKGVE